MNVKNACKDYFHGFQELATFKNNKLKKNVINLLKVVSYFIVVIPASVGIIYGISSLVGRIKKSDGSLEQNKSNSLGRKTLECKEEKKDIQPTSANPRKSLVLIRGSINPAEGNSIVLKIQERAVPADQENAETLCSLGDKCIHEKSYEEAAQYYKQAAEKGLAEAQCNLGILYASGKGVLLNDKLAVEWYQKAAQQKHAPALCNLGYMYKEGRGVQQSDKDAACYYLQAANLNDVTAQFNLGDIYLNGMGVTQDFAKALYYFKRAADQGYLMAQFNLGLLYVYQAEENKEKPVEVKEYIEKAMAYLRLAARQGDGQARAEMRRISALYEVDEGV